MFDISIFDEDKLAVALLLEDHDLITDESFKSRWHDGEVEEVETIDRTDDKWELTVTYRSVNSDETTVFQSGEIKANTSLTPGENDSYRSGMVVVFDDLIEGHRVILEGDHGGAGISDEAYEAHFMGSIVVVPASQGDAELAQSIARSRRDLMNDVTANLISINMQMQNATFEEMKDSGFADAFAALARIMARTS